LQENKTLVLRFFAEMDRQNWQAMLDTLAPDFAAHVPGAPELNADTFHQFATVFYSAFPDLRHEFTHVIAEGDDVVTHGTFGGTHRGELQGIAPTGTRISVPVVHIDRVEGGKIVEHHGVANMLALMEQLGAFTGVSPGSQV